MRALYSRLITAAERRGTELGEIAIARVLKNENNASAIVGARNLHEVEWIVDGGDALSSIDAKTIHALLQNL